ncbi:MAG: ferrous iron transport protein B [Acholeplasma sp.]|nr:ferrous iron transport protein B [Acholeplasma sp.]
MRIALIGNQNSGKTTLFNALTGSNQKIGNWPGVTIEQKVGYIEKDKHEIIDLPGIYSLSPYTIEESISRAFLLQEKIDLIVNIIDATQLERSLYLTTQLLELNIDMIICLNMADTFAKKGISIHKELLEQKLNTSIIEISALKKTGIQKLIQCIDSQNYLKHKPLKIFNPNIEKTIQYLEEKISEPNKRFLSIKLLESDPIIEHAVDVTSLTKPLEKVYGYDFETIIASGRYAFIEKIKKETFVRIHHGDKLTESLDKVFLNKFLAIPIFGLVMFLIYYLSVGVVGSLTVDFVDGSVSQFSAFMFDLLKDLGAHDFSASLVSDGMIAGVGAVLNFVPQLIILFLLISALEGSGYMTRIAFFLDRLFKKFGLSGKALIPFIIGSGCSVPGIMATRTIESQDERRISIMLTPFIPCSAKLPIIALFAGFFFPNNSGFVSFSLYMMSIVVILVSALIMKTFFFKGQPSSYITELPNYRIPNFRYVFRDVYERVKEFIDRAGTIILLSSVLIWFLSAYSFRLEYGVDVNESMLSYLGRGFAYVFYPMLGDLSWAASVSAIQGLVAKEQVVSSLAVIGGLSADITQGNIILNAPIYQFFTPASAYAFMVFNLFSAPCFAAIGAMHKELGSRRKTWFAILFQTGLAYLLATLIFQLGTFIGGIS